MTYLAPAESPIRLPRYDKDPYTWRKPSRHRTRSVFYGEYSVDERERHVSITARNGVSVSQWHKNTAPPPVFFNRAKPSQLLPRPKLVLPRFVGGEVEDDHKNLLYVREIETETANSWLDCPLALVMKTNDDSSRTFYTRGTDFFSRHDMFLERFARP